VRGGHREPMARRLRVGSPGCVRRYRCRIESRRRTTPASRARNPPARLSTRVAAASRTQEARKRSKARRRVDASSGRHHGRRRDTAWNGHFPAKCLIPGCLRHVLPAVPLLLRDPSRGEAPFPADALMHASPVVCWRPGSRRPAAVAAHYRGRACESRGEALRDDVLLLHICSTNAAAGRGTARGRRPGLHDGHAGCAC
jgi:hypothetical protein